jgi:3',5'-cyclic AMP phosphodiesterase CpdA
VIGLLASIGLLHFSDLHVGTRGLSAEWPTIEDALFDDLEKIYGATGPWDLVVFSGDLAFQGYRKEFKSVHEFLTSLWGKFRELGCVPRLVAVPGNHDLHRQDPDPDRARSLTRTTIWRRFC